MAPARRVIHDARQTAKRLSVDLHGFDAIGRGFQRTYRRARRALQRARIGGDPKDFHAFRTPSKRHLYQLRLFEGIWPELLSAHVGEVDRLGELLGEHHDLSLLAEELTRLLDASEREPLEKTIAKRERKLEKQILALGARCFAERPRDITRRFARYYALAKRD
ncbi:MAG: CHAD domain-containing protein [Myxococcota bacterium]